MLKFANTYMYLFFSAVPLMVAAMILFLRWKKRRRSRLIDPALEPKVVPGLSRGKLIARSILMICIYVTFVIALARPKFGMKVEKVKAEGVEFVIALDVSNSMLAEDVSPNRLARAKQAINSLLDRLKTDGVGLVIFAGIADLQSTITNDYASVKNLLPSIDAGSLDVQGTSIAEAINTSMKAFPEDIKNGAAIVVLTDGEDHEGAAIDAAKNARNKGIIVHTIGLGSLQGGPIPVYENGERKGYKADKNNQTVITKMNEAALQEIAAAGGGIYVRGVDPTGALRKVYDQMQQMQKTERAELNEEGLEDRFQWVLALLLVLLVVELVLSERSSRWVKKLELFD
jgi:Ca-activated chloride channel family protein